MVEAWRAPRAASAIGVGWERLTFWWKSIQPDGPNSYNLWATDRDHEINREIAAGRQLVGLLINTPDWAAANPPPAWQLYSQGPLSALQRPAQFLGNFVKLIVAHLQRTNQQLDLVERSDDYQRPMVYVARVVWRTTLN